MKLIGNKDEGYKLISSFEQGKSEKPSKPKQSKNANKPPEGGTTDPDEGRKEE